MKLASLIPLMLFAVLAKAQNSYWSPQPQSTTLTRTIVFENTKYRFTDELTFNRVDYNYYRSLPKRPHYAQDYGQYLAEHSSHPYLLTLAKKLDEDAGQLGYSNYDMVKYLMDFVQQAIPYASDPYNYGYDYPKYPIETIVDGQGDCEDKAALLATLLHVFGFDAVLLIQNDHAAVGVHCGNCHTGGYNYNGKFYAYIETTAKGWDMAQIPPDRYKAAYIVEIPSSTPRYRRDQIYNDNSAKEYAYNSNQPQNTNRTSNNDNSQNWWYGGNSQGNNNQSQNNSNTTWSNWTGWSNQSNNTPNQGNGTTWDNWFNQNNQGANNTAWANWWSNQGNNAQNQGNNTTWGNWSGWNGQGNSNQAQNGNNTTSNSWPWNAQNCNGNGWTSTVTTSSGKSIVIVNGVRYEVQGSNVSVITINGQTYIQSY